MTLDKIKEKIEKEMRRIEKEYDVDEWVGMDAVELRKLDPTVVLSIGCYRAYQIVIGFIIANSIAELKNHD